MTLTLNSDWEPSPVDQHVLREAMDRAPRTRSLGLGAQSSGSSAFRAGGLWLKVWEFWESGSGVLNPKLEKMGILSHRKLQSEQDSGTQSSQLWGHELGA